MDETTAAPRPSLGGLGVSQIAYWGPPRYDVPNQKVGLEPFPPEEANAVQGRVLKPMNTQALQALRVIFGNERYAAGSICYIKASHRRQSLWAKEVLSVDGLDFIHVPETEIVVSDRYPTGK